MTEATGFRCVFGEETDFRGLVLMLGLSYGRTDISEAETYKTVSLYLWGQKHVPKGEVLIKRGDGKVQQSRAQGAEGLIGVMCTEVTMTFARDSSCLTVSGANKPQSSPTAFREKPQRARSHWQSLEDKVITKESNDLVSCGSFGALSTASR